MKSLSYQYELISKNRMSLFGISLIWIFFRHTFFYNNYIYGFGDYFVQIGDCGVDLFLFLSGFGLYFSYQKSEDIMFFYKKRVQRILPTVFILLFVFKFIAAWIQDDSWWSIINPWEWFLAIYSKYWFIGAILLFYLFFPLIYSIVKRNASIAIVGAFVIGILGILIIKMMHISILNQLVVYLARLPIFVIGVVFASHQFLFQKKTCILLLFVISIPLLYFLPKDFQRMVYCFTTLGIIILFPIILDKLPYVIKKELQRIGKSSLEFYLIHIFLFSYGILNNVDKYVPQSVCVLLVLTLISLLSILANQLITKFTLRLQE